ncbi:MAG: helix-turn-helix domain-containing protein, partial [Chitinispirillaceae bacterium]|nr:helix-turn-helix domain-containing protein [Chitinispirillaceae bacterium]
MSSIDSGHFVIDDTLSGMKKPAGSDRKLKDRLTGLPGQGIAWVRRNPFTAAPAGIALLLFGLWVVARRNRSKEKAQRFMTTTRLSLMNGEVQRACLHIENNYMDPSLTPASVCTAIVTGQPFLETMFERELGLDIASYINQVRMHRARQIIRWNITADASFVAAKVGFRETGEFEKQFKKATGSDLETFRRNQTASPDTAA